MGELVLRAGELALSLTDYNTQENHHTPPPSTSPRQHNKVCHGVVDTGETPSEGMGMSIRDLVLPRMLGCLICIREFQVHAGHDLIRRGEGETGCQLT